MTIKFCETNTTFKIKMYSPPPVDFYVPIHSCLLPTDLLYANVLNIFSREIEQTGVIYQSSMYKREIFFFKKLAHTIMTAGKSQELHAVGKVETQEKCVVPKIN